MVKLKIYLDTSVISHLQQEDVPEKMQETRELWEQFKAAFILTWWMLKFIIWFWYMLFLYSYKAIRCLILKIQEAMHNKNIQE